MARKPILTADHGGKDPTSYTSVVDFQILFTFLNFLIVTQEVKIQTDPLPNFLTNTARVACSDFSLPCEALAITHLDGFIIAICREAKPCPPHYSFSCMGKLLRF